MRSVNSMRILAVACTVAVSGFAVLAQQAPPSNQFPPKLSPEQAAAAQKAHEEQLHNDWAYLSKYRADDQKLPPPALNDPRVVFMGDSITEAWGRHRTPPIPDAAEFFPGKPYINRGISGQTTPQMLVRFRQDVINLKPKVVVFLAGINDLAENTGPMELADTEANIQSMSDLAIANGIRVVLCSVLPAKAFWWHPGIDPTEKIVELNEWLRRYAETKRFPYVDYYDALADPDRGLPNALSRDGVHPNAKGYAIMAPLAQKGIDEALGQGSISVPGVAGQMR
jgi:lysophospholipase L1-like esterase